MGAFAAVLGVAASAGAVLVVPPGPEPLVRSGMSRWLDVPSYAGAERRVAGASFSACHPYMIDELVSCAALAGLRGQGGEAWASWRHLGHALYREDRFTLSLGARLPGRCGPVSVRAVPAVERRAVEGMPAAVSGACSFSVACEPRRLLVAAAEWMPCGVPAGAPRRVSVSVTARTGSVWASVSRILRGEEVGETTFRCAASLAGRAAIVSSYRSSSAELACGLALRGGPLALDLSWSYHPALGKTFAAGLGRWWTW